MQFLLAFSIMPVTEKVTRLGGLYRREYRPSRATGLADALIVEENGLSCTSYWISTGAELISATYSGLHSY